uniref:Uncharacterized protein n=1 Tax=Arundo donax TaxID=35708 RepID=A0A0A9GZI7_ARUDO
MKFEYDTSSPEHISAIKVSSKLCSVSFIFWHCCVKFRDLKSSVLYSCSILSWL